MTIGLMEVSGERKPGLSQQAKLTLAPCLTSGQSLRDLSAHSVFACICVYLSSDFCNPCFSSVSSSSGAVRIHSPHFFPYTSLTLTFSRSFSLPEAKCLGQLCIYSSVCSFVPFLCISLPHTQTRTHWCSAVRSGD